MKSTVDLTANRDFGRLGGTFLHFEMINFSRRRSIFANMFNRLMNTVEHGTKNFWLIKRRGVPHVYKFVDVPYGTYCDCCGKKISNRVPWKERLGLCDKCDGALEAQFTGTSKIKRGWHFADMNSRDRVPFATWF